VSNILFILSGSIACYKACDAISRLVQAGHAVRTVATEAALRFVGGATLEGLTRHPVATDLFASGAALEHIDLTRWADVAVICPATANTLNRLAAGLADDLAGALWLAYDRRKPFLVAPAMNPAMWSHPATTAATAQLRAWGVRFIEPDLGRTACGEVGEGRLADPAAIVAAIGDALHPRGGLRVLITSGGTAEPIDGVRVLSNVSTGATGATLADFLAGRGHAVTLLRATSAVAPSAPCAEETFFTFADLAAALDRQLGANAFDAVIHAAAVSDYHVAAIAADGQPVKPRAGKFSSTAAEASLTLRPNPKLLETLRSRSRTPRLVVVGFKLTQGASADDAAAAVQRLLTTSAADYVVHNDLTARRDARVFPAQIWERGGGIVARCADRATLAAELERILLARAAPSTPPARNAAAGSAPLPA